MTFDLHVFIIWVLGVRKYCAFRFFQPEKVKPCCRLSVVKNV